MKKTLIILALAMVSFANAQKGSILVAGSIGFGSSNESQTSSPAPGTESESKLNNLYFNPKVGYQITNNITIGIEASVSSNKNENTTTPPGGIGATSNTIKNNGFVVGPFMRYSKPLSETFSVFADLGVGFQSQKRTTDSNNGFFTTTTTQKGDGIHFGITPALFINMKKGFGVNIGIGGLGFQTMKWDDDVVAGVVDHKASAFYLDFGQTFNIGISKNF